MATVDDYVSGEILKDVKRALSALKLVKVPVIGYFIGKELLKMISKFEPRVVNVEKALKLIENADKVAVGRRICFELHRDILTESVFLDELADGLVAAKKARYVTKDEAISVLRKYSKYPIIISKVSGKYMEICCTLPKVCVYWNMEKKGLRCLK